MIDVKRALKAAGFILLLFGICGIIGVLMALVQTYIGLWFAGVILVILTGWLWYSYYKEMT